MAESSAVMHVIARIHTDFPEKFGVPRPDAKHGLATLCIGGGMGVATVFEKC